MKAYRVEERGGDEATIAFGTRGQAKAIGANKFGCHFLDVEVERAPWADNLKSKGGEIDWDDKGAAETMRANRWFYGELFERKTCKECGLFEFATLPLSKIEDDVCGYCKAKDQT